MERNSVIVPGGKLLFYSELSPFFFPSFLLTPCCLLARSILLPSIFLLLRSSLHSISFVLLPPFFQTPSFVLHISFFTGFLSPSFLHTTSFPLSPYTLFPADHLLSPSSLLFFYLIPPLLISPSYFLYFSFIHISSFSLLPISFLPAFLFPSSPLSYLLSSCLPSSFFPFLPISFLSALLFLFPSYSYHIPTCLPPSFFLAFVCFSWLLPPFFLPPSTPFPFLLNFNPSPIARTCNCTDCCTPSKDLSSYSSTAQYYFSTVQYFSQDFDLVLAARFVQQVNATRHSYEYQQQWNKSKNYISLYSLYTVLWQGRLYIVEKYAEPWVLFFFC